MRIKIGKSFEITMGRKQSRTYGAIIQWKDKEPIWTPKDYKKLTEAGYQNCMIVYRCVNVITEACAGIPWYLAQERQDGEMVDIPRHDLLDLLRRPNPKQGKARFTKNTIGFLLLSGNSYIESVGPDVKPPKELYSLRPDRVKVVPGNQFEIVSGYSYEVPGWKPIPLTNDECLHLYLFHPTNDFYGLSPLEVAAKGVDIHNLAMEWNAKLLQNDARPSGAFVAPGEIDDEEFERQKKELKEEYMGPKKAGTPLFLLEGGVKWEQFGLSPKEMDWLNTDKVMTRKICMVYGVPPELIGDSEQKTYSNYKEARKALYEETVLPLMNWLRDELNNWLVPKFGENLYLDYNKDQIDAIQVDRIQLWNTMTAAVGQGIINRNEARAELGYDEGPPELNIFTMPGNQLPLGGAGMEEE